MAYGIAIFKELSNSIFIIYNSRLYINTNIIGELILSQYGNTKYNRNIGALKLAPEQNGYYTQYFLHFAKE